MAASVYAEMSSAVRTFRINEGAMRSLLSGPSGPVSKDLSRRAIRVESAAKRAATGRPGPNVITGRLRGSITWRLGVDSQGVYADVGSNVVYARPVEALYPFLLPSLAAAS